MEKGIKKRTIVIAGRKTSLNVEDLFWKSAKEIAAVKRISLTKLVNQIRGESKPHNLSSAVRLFVLAYYKILAADAGGQGIEPPPRLAREEEFPASGVLDASGRDN